MEWWKTFVFFAPPLAIGLGISASKGSPPIFGGQQVVSLVSFHPIARFLNRLE
jgi:hypothetical protein